MCQNNAQIVKRKLKESPMPSKTQNGLSVIKIAIRSFVKQNFQKKNTQIGKVVSLPMKLTDDGLRNILNIWHISKQGDMPVNETQRANTLSKNGGNFVETISGNVQSVIKEKSLPKTTSDLFHLAGQIISRISNHFAVLAIVVNGKSFNIYENPELLSPPTLSRN